MRWRDLRRSENVEDRRGMPVSRGLVGGGIGTIILVLVALYFGVDPSLILNMGGSQTNVQTSPQMQQGARDEPAQFVAAVLGDTEETWHALFRKMGKTYTEPKLVLFTGAVNSACGFAQAAVGPFYCPGDHKVYIDLSFYRDLKERFQAPGDFAQAYVIAHEVGHHVQTLLGISEKIQSARGRLDEGQFNKLLVRQELQADCLAGVWAHHADRVRRVLEQGDIEEALGAAASIGDDRIQKQTRGYVTPDSFTHGSSEQRVRWFRRGIEAGDPVACDTFRAGSL
jgi:hypothetical protein